MNKLDTALLDQMFSEQPQKTQTSPGAFDDLIPKKNNSESGMFDDLMPESGARPGGVMNSQNSVNEEPNLALNAGKLALNRTADLAGSMVSGLGKVITKGSEYVADGINSLNHNLDVMGAVAGVTDDKNLDSLPERNIKPAPIGGFISDVVAPAISDFEAGYQETYSMEKLVEDPNVENVMGMIAEKGVASIPDMYMAIKHLPVYIGTRTEEIANERAQQDGRDQANANDYLISFQTAVATSLMERIAPMGAMKAGGSGVINGVKEIGKTAGKEAGTEFLQENLEYAATNAGTQTGWDGRTALMRGGEGAIVGGGVGAGTSVAAQGYNKFANKEAAQTRNSPNPDQSSETFTPEPNPPQSGSPLEQEPLVNQTPNAQEASIDLTQGDVAFDYNELDPSMLDMNQNQVSSQEATQEPIYTDEPVNFDDGFVTPEVSSPDLPLNENQDPLTDRSPDELVLSQTQAYDANPTATELAYTRLERGAISPEKFNDAIDGIKVSSPVDNEIDFDEQSEKAKDSLKQLNSDVRKSRNSKTAIELSENLGAKIKNRTKKVVKSIKQKEQSKQFDTRFEKRLAEQKAIVDKQEQASLRAEYDKSQLAKEFRLAEEIGIERDFSTLHKAITQSLKPTERDQINPIMKDFVEEEAQLSSIEEGANEAATSPTNERAEPSEAQKEAGNYKKGRVRHTDLDIAIENPKGSIRTGKDETGKEWESEMASHYGDITGTIGADGDAIDVFVKPDTSTSEKVFIVNQVDPNTKAFDEHKVMLGFGGKAEAKKGYYENYDKSWYKGHDVVEVTKDEFNDWLKNGDTTKPFVKKNKIVDVTPELKEALAEEVIQKAEQVNNVPDTDITHEIIDAARIAMGGKNGIMATKVRDAIGDIYSRSIAIGIGSNKDTFNSIFQEETSKLDSITLDAVNDILGQVKAQTSRQTELKPAKPEKTVEDKKPISKPVTPAALEKQSTEIVEKLPKAKVDKIEDFGEVLQGANKHNYTFNEQLNDDIDVKAVPLSKSFPQPDYEKLASEGADPRALAFMAQLRGEIKSKPRDARKVERWSHQVSAARHNAKKLLEMGEGGSEFLIQSLQKSDKGRGDYLKHLPLVLDIAKEIPAKNIKALGDYKLEHTLYTLFRNEKNVNKWVVTDTKSKGGFGGMGNMKHFDTSEEAVAHIKSQVTDESIINGKKLAKFDVWTERGKRGVYFLGKKIGTGKFIELKQFPTAREAREYSNENNEELVALLKEKKKIKAHRRPDNNPRVGDDHRKGVDATPEMFDEAFGFRGVQFGNWVENNKRQNDLNYAYDGLMDLAGILDIPSKALSLNGDLGLAFGARGKGGENAASAHYEPGTVVINLTKKMGSGSLAHEWWHALDNYFSKMDKTKLGSVTKHFITEGGRSLGVKKDGKHQRATSEDFGVRQEVYDAFTSLTKAIKNETKLAERSAELDKLRGKDYWGTVIEMTARSFERYVIDKLSKQGFESDYLANIVKESSTEASKEVSDYPYPLAVEMDVVNKAYDGIFDILQTKETDKGLALFSADTSVRVSPNKITLAQAQKVVDDFKAEYNGNIPLDFRVVEKQEQLYGPENTVEKVGLIKGSYHPKSGIFGIASSNMQDRSDARETLRHEILGHFGLNTFKPKDKKAILQKIINSKNDSSLKDAWEKVDKNYPELDAMGRAEEVFASIAENPPKSKSLWNDLVILVRKALRFVGIGKGSISKDEIESYIQDISNSIKSGRATQQTFPKSDQDQFRREGENTPFTLADESRIDILIRKYQDKFKPLKSTQEAIIKSGKEISDNENAYVAEELFHGKTEEDLRIMERDLIQPLVNEMTNNNIDLNELDLYLIAKHAEERNAYIATINDALPDGGSGMKNAEANSVIERFTAEGKIQALDAAASKIYLMTSKRKSVLKDAGLISDNELDSWNESYEHYVPLKGFADGEVDNNGKSVPRVGKGFAISGKESMKALGRRSMAASPATQVIQDLTETFIRKRKNEVGNTFLELVKANPNTELWNIYTDDNPEVDKRFDKAKGKVVETPLPMAMVSDKYFTTKVKGKTYYIKIEDDRLMTAMKNLGVDQVGSIVKVLGTVNRVLSTVNTSLNPEFTISNMGRDIQTAIYNVMAEQDLPTGKIKGEKIAAKMVKDWVVARKGIALSLAGKPQATGKAGEYQKLYDQFRGDGAKTGYFDMKDIDQQVDELNTMLSMAGKSKKGALLRSTKKLGDLVENVNQSVENAIRLTAYKQALDAGVSRQKASSLAKNLTVNFNRKGELGTTLNALFMFANASIQGTAQFLRSMQGYKTPEGKYKFTGAQKAAATMVAGSFALAMINRMFSEDDDDGVSYWDKVPGHIKERNIVIMKSVLGGDPEKYWSIPLPYGYNIFSVMGTTAENVTQGSMKTTKGAATILNAFIGSFSPIGSQESDDAVNAVAKTLTPTIGQPIIQLAINENFVGNKIFRENYQFGTPLPDSSLAKTRTLEHWKALSTFLNEATGGSYYQSGAIDINPESFAHVFNFVTGAAGSFVSRSFNAGEKTIKGEELKDREIPFYRKLNGEVEDSYQDQDKFYERKTEIEQLSNELKSLKGKDRSDFRKENSSKINLLNHTKTLNKQLSSLRKRVRSIEENDNYENKSEAIEKLKARQDSLIDSFNKKYDKLNN